MESWVIALCKAVDWLVYGGMLVPFLIAHQRRKNLTGGLRTLRFVPLFLLGMYGLMHLAIAIWQYSIPINHLNTIGETLLYLKVYYDEFKSNSTKLSIRIITIFFIIFAVIDSFFLEGFSQINSYTNLVESIIIIFLGLLFFERALIRTHRAQLLRTPMFVVTIGIIIYLSGTIILYLITNNPYLSTSEYNSRLLYLIGSCFLGIMALLFCRAFLLVHPDRVDAT
ncbi:hypothetical protein J7E24_02235 [Hymenobacter sp. ISL-91]|uniref:hypothetical protein n=1 Tax=Hymenobacter sp. ISL-91 TaxID=2819151 RepID=UPI001BECB978|nr:hypothetical protein [Hymenobacter sp. ISL-91]MBT2556589.1 hypothetical protein [Hymenobacter sp. ISL-91]